MLLHNVRKAQTTARSEEPSSGSSLRDPHRYSGVGVVVDDDTLQQRLDDRIVQLIVAERTRSGGGGKDKSRDFLVAPLLSDMRGEERERRRRGGLWVGGGGGAGDELYGRAHRGALHPHVRVPQQRNETSGSLNRKTDTNSRREKKIICAEHFFAFTLY